MAFAVRVNSRNRPTTAEIGLVRAPAAHTSSPSPRPDGDASSCHCQNGRTRMSYTQTAGNYCQGMQFAKPLDECVAAQRGDEQPWCRELPNPEGNVTVARETDIFLEVSLRRLASACRFRRRVADGPRSEGRIMMTDRPSHNLDGLEIDLARRIDGVCRRFEADWRRGANRASRTIWARCLTKANPHCGPSWRRWCTNFVPRMRRSRALRPALPGS